MQKIEIPIVELKQPQTKRTIKTEMASKEGGLNCKVESDSNQLTVGMKTMGCKVNSFESELIAESLQLKNFKFVDLNEKADCYIVNTCTVTNEADRQARQIIRKLIKLNPSALIVVTGCYAQMDPEACSRIPGVDLVVGNDKKLDMHSLLPKLIKNELPQVLVGDLDQQISLPESLLSEYSNQTRAFVQIQQGCDQGCTFCIIHQARGPSRSIGDGLIRRQIQRLVMNGFPEIVLCGVDLGSYGDDIDPVNEPKSLVQLIRSILQLDFPEGNPFRIRLSSIDPAHISDELIELMATNQRICPHIHLSLQSGSTLILKRMKRRYDRAYLIERIKKLREAIPGLVLSADVMVGFPTENEEDFLATKQVLQELDVPFPHVFSYSIRKGTPAARIPMIKHISSEVKKNRNRQLRELGDDLLNTTLKHRIGKMAYVLPEKQTSDGQHWFCRSEDYLTALLPKNQAKHAQWQKVSYTAIQGKHLLAKVVD